MARDAGRLPEARDLQAQAVAQLRHGSDLPAFAHALRHLADLDASARDPRADAEYDEALALYRSLDDAPELDLADAVRGKAAHAERLGRLDQARVLWLKAEARERLSRLGA